MDSQSSKNRGPSFNHDEDFAITKTWSEISEDACVGTDQSKSIYWDRIFTNYELMGKPPNTTRNSKTISTRWSLIQGNINKFSGILTNLEAKYVSGKSPGDKIIDAQTVFREQEKKPWKWRKCWEFVKDTFKWKNIPVFVPKKMKVGLVILDGSNDGSTPSTPSTPNTTIPMAFNMNFDHTQMLNPLERPMGQKQAKEKRKLNQEQTIQEFQESNKAFKNFVATWTKRSAKMEEIEAKKLENEAKRLENEGKMVDALALKEQRKQDKIRLKQKQQDRNIMNMNLESLSQVQRQFFEMEQQRILNKYLQGDMGGGSSSS